MADANPISPHERPTPPPNKQHGKTREVRRPGQDKGTVPSPKDAEGKQDRPIARAAKKLSEDNR